MVLDMMLVNLFMEVFNMSTKSNIIAISKIIIFIILFIIIFIILTYIMKPINVNLKNITGFYGEDKNSLDMVYIGGSAAFVYW